MKGSPAAVGSNPPEQCRREARQRGAEALYPCRACAARLWIIYIKRRSRAEARQTRSPGLHLDCLIWARQFTEPNSGDHYQPCLWIVEEVCQGTTQWDGPECGHGSVGEMGKRSFPRPVTTRFRGAFRPDKWRLARLEAPSPSVGSLMAVRYHCPKCHEVGTWRPKMSPSPPGSLRDESCSRISVFVEWLAPFGSSSGTFT